MKKLFIITLAVLFLSGAAYAVEYEFSGMINTAGTYISNSSGEEEKAGTYMFYDMEFDGSLGIRPTDKDLIFLNWEIQDKDFDGDYDSETNVSDDNILFKKAYGSHKFDTGTTLDFGLMSGGAWGTAFGDNGSSFYRVKVVQTTGFGAVVALVEKNAENGSNYADSDPAGSSDYAAHADADDFPVDAEADDGDTYALALITKVGDINVKPLFKYVTLGTLSHPDLGTAEYDEGTDLTVTAFVLAADGSFGAIGFEAEFDYVSYAYDTEDGGWTGLGDDEDYTKMGLYANAWMSMDALEVGGLLAWGSYDKEGGTAGGGAGFGFGEDFGPGYWVMDWEHFGNGNAEYYAATLVALYGSFAASDAMSFYGCVEYMMSNEEETDYEGATGTILNASMAYKISDNVTYSVGGASGSFAFADWDNAAGVEQDKTESDPFMRAFHKITISF